jgi:hypothetical protein
MRLLRALQIPALLLLVCSLYYWRITLTNEYTWLNSPDLAYQVLPWYEFQASEWHAGRIPLWDPYHWSGQPVLGQVITGAAFPLNWLLFSLPLEHGWIRQVYMHWYFVLLHFLGALFCYLLCRDLKRSRGASLIAGCAFGLGGFMGVTDWPVMLNGAMWTPLVLLFMLRVARGDRPHLSAPLAGAMLGMAFLSGHHQVPIFIALMCGGLWLYMFLRGGRLDWRMVRLAAAFSVMVACVSALQLLPAVEYGRLALRWVGVDDPVGWDQKVPYQMQAQFAYRPLAIFGTVFPSMTPGQEPFFGVVAVSLGVAALLLLRRKTMVRLLGAVALGGLLYSIAPFDTFQGMLYALVPMVEKARSPSMAIVLFHAACAALLAFAIDSAKVRQSRHLHWFLFALPLVFYAGVMGFVYAGNVPVDERLLMTPLVAMLACALLALWRRREIGPLFAKSALLFLVLLELGNVTFYSMGSKFLKTGRPDFLAQLAVDPDIFEYFRTVRGPFRVDIDRQSLPANLGDWHGIETYNGYLASLTANLRSLTGDENKKMDLFAVNYAIRRTPNRPGQQDIFTAKSGMKVFRNPSAMPRAWTVHSARQVPKPEIANDPRHEALFLRPPPQLETCAGEDRLAWVSRKPSASALTVETGCRALVVIADTYFPGWKATVDGKPAEILEVDGALRGIVVEKGSHRISMRYRPTSVIAGAVITGLGFAITLMLLALAWRAADPPQA